jgi:M6 family metalloprotease-like protein
MTFWSKTLRILPAMILLFTVSWVPGGPYRGEYMARVYDYFTEGKAWTEHTLTTEGGETLRLIFPESLSLPEPGTYLSVWGERRGDVLYVETYTQEGPEGGNPTLGEQRFIVVLVNFQDDPTQNVTVAQVRSRFFDPNYSADKWWRENSFGKTWATGDVVGWITLPMNRQCDPDLIRQHTIAAIDPLFYLPYYNRLVILIPGGAGCSWGGLGTLGMQTFQTQDGPWRVSTAWIRSEYYNETLHHPRRAVFVTAHEVGHNFGRHHARSVVWSGGVALGPFDCNACGGTVSEYGDAYCSLGGSWRPGHHNAEHKEKLNWFEPGNLVTVTRTGIYEIDAYSRASQNPKVLKIHRGFGPSTQRDEWLYVEWRQPIGFDTEIDYFNGLTYNGVILHYNYGQTNTATYILDMTPGDNELTNAVLPIGTLWSDAYTYTSIRPLGVVGDRMRVEVQIGVPLLPTSYTLIRGSVHSGTFENVFSSDDQRWTLRSGIIPSTGSPFVQVVLRTQHTGTAPNAFRFELECATSASFLQRVEFFNYSANRWDVVDERRSTLGDSFVEANIWQNPTRYLRSSDGEMQVRLSWIQDRPALAFPHFVHIDQAVWKILR